MQAPGLTKLPSQQKVPKYRPSINIDNLIAICTGKLKNCPNHKKALYIRASAYIKKGEYQTAIQDCNKLLETDCDNVGGYYLRGCANEKLGQIDLAIEDFSKVLSLDENHVLHKGKLFSTFQLNSLVNQSDRKNFQANCYNDSLSLLSFINYKQASFKVFQLQILALEYLYQQRIYKKF